MAMLHRSQVVYGVAVRIEVVDFGVVIWSSADVNVGS
jgi:hypothetical protein